MPFVRRFIIVGILLLVSNTIMSTSIVRLTTEFMKNPMGIDVSHPRFAWQMQSDKYGAAQTAYRVVVSSSRSELDNGFYVFDTGKVNSSSSIGIVYSGDALRPSTRYYWKVTVWDEKGNVLQSEPNWFETGLLDADWHNAKWIGSSQYLLSKYRASFVIDYQFRLEKKSNKAVFVFGAKSPSNYLMLTIDLSNGARFNLGHVYGKSVVTDYDEDILSLIPENKKKATHSVRLSVMGGDNYDIGVTIDGQRVKCSKANKDNIYNFMVNGITPAEPNSNCRLYQIGYIQPKGENVVYSNIEVGEPFYKQTLYVDTEIHHVVGDGEVHLWQPGSDISAPMLRRSFSISKTIKQARLYATSKGIYQFYINGKTVGDGYYNPGWTDYRFRMMYNTYDVTPLLCQGDNGLGVALGAGWYSDVIGWAGLGWQDQYGLRQSALALLKIDYEDGTTEYVMTDDRWKCYDKGPIEANSLYNGEDYNAQKEISGWSDGNFNDSSWKTVRVENISSGEPKLQAYIGGMIQNNVTLRPMSVKKVGNAYIYDFGQNMVGVPCLLNMKGRAGQQITIHYAEMLYPEVIPDSPVEPYTIDMYKERKGQMYLDNYRSALSTDHYIFKGDANGETYQPLFTSHGFRYLAIEGLDEALPLTSVEGIVLESIGKQGSDYETSNTEVNRLFQNIVWGQRGNFLSVPTDCPQRDERLGWMGDAQVFARSATYNMNTDPFYTRWLYTLRDDQGRNGSYGDYYPCLGTSPNGFDINSAKGGSGAWADAGIIIPWQVYQQYGDVGILQQHYESMCRYMDFLERKADRYNILPEGGYADWVAPVFTNSSLINTAYYAYDARMMQQMAEALDKIDDAARYSRLFERIKISFNKTFLDKEGYTVSKTEKGVEKINTQTSYVLPLQFGLIDDSIKSKVVQHLVDAVESNGNKLTTGFLGTPYICLVLSDNGRSDVAYKLFLQTEYPSWLFPVRQGATTMWERWNSYTVKNGFGPVGMNSFNHYAYGAIEEWMMSHSLGIQRDEKNPGYKLIIIQPEIGGELDYVNGGFESMQGYIGSRWEKRKNGYTYGVTVPGNTTTSLFLPANKASGIKLLKGKEGASFVSYKNGKVQYELKSGTYEFVCTCPAN